MDLVKDDNGFLGGGDLAVQHWLCRDGVIGDGHAVVVPGERAGTVAEVVVELDAEVLGGDLGPLRPQVRGGGHDDQATHLPTVVELLGGGEREPGLAGTGGGDAEEV